MVALASIVALASASMVALPRPLLTVPTAPASLPPGLVESGANSTDVAFSRTSVVAFRAAGGLSNCARLPAASSDAHRHKATNNLLPIVSVFLILVRVGSPSSSSLQVPLQQLGIRSARRRRRPFLAGSYPSPLLPTLAGHDHDNRSQNRFKVVESKGCVQSSNVNFFSRILGSGSLQFMRRGGPAAGRQLSKGGGAHSPGGPREGQGESTRRG